MRGLIFGVALLGPRGAASLVSVDADGVIWCFGEGTRPRLVADCLNRGWLVHASLGRLVYALEAGLCFGVTPTLLARIPARELVSVLPGEDG